MQVPTPQIGKTRGVFLWNDMDQLNFFDDLPARRSDPATSKIAAEEVEPRLSGYRLVFANRLLTLGAATAQEVAQGCESIRKRAKELQRRGIIEVVGTRPCRITGRTASVYRVKDHNEHQAIYRGGEK